MNPFARKLILYVQRQFFKALVSISIVALLSITCAAQARDQRPGKGVNPAFICFKTTITDKGHTYLSRITRPSGNKTSDQRAMKLVRTLKFVAERGVKREERDIYMLVKIFENGQFAFATYELNESLPEICNTPFDSKQDGLSGI